MICAVTCTLISDRQLTLCDRDTASKLHKPRQSRSKLFHHLPYCEGRRRPHDLLMSMTDTRRDEVLGSRQQIASDICALVARGGDGVPACVARKPRQTCRSIGSDRLISDRAQTGGWATRWEIGSQNTLSLAMPLRCLRTVLRRLRGQVDKAQGDSKMRRQREMQGWPGTRAPESDASVNLQVIARCSLDQLAGPVDLIRDAQELLALVATFEQPPQRRRRFL